MTKKKIKILFTIPNFDTAGSGKVVYDLVKNIDKDVFEPEICCFHGRGEFFKEVKKLNVNIHLFNFTAKYYPLYTFPIRVWKICKFFRKNKFNLIHSWHWSSDFSEPLAAKLAGIPFVYTKKSMSWGNKAWKWRTWLSTNIITISSEMQNLFFLNCAEKIVHFPIGIDLKYFSPREKLFVTPEGMNFNKSDFIIVSIVNLVPVKGIDLLLKAVELMDDLSIKVIIIGDNDNDYGRDLMDNFQSDSIYFLNKKMDIRPYLALCDLFVIPTKDEGRGEGLGVAPIEAMAMERIVIGSRVGGIKDVLNAFQECLFQPDNVDNIIEKIEYIRSLDKKERLNLQRQMSAYVQSEFSIKLSIKNHESLYKSMLKL